MNSLVALILCRIKDLVASSEVARPGQVVGLRDSKNPTGGHLTVPRTAFDDLLTTFTTHNGTR